MHPSQLPTGSATRPFGHVPGMPSPFPPQSGGYASGGGGVGVGGGGGPQAHPLQQQSATQAYAAAVPVAGGAPVPSTAAPVPSASSSGGRPSERALLSTASAMAQRSYNEGNYAMAKRLLDSISVSYRHEGWKSILTAALLTALDCAARLRLAHDAVQYSLELVGHSLLVTHQQKVLIMQQMMSIAAAPPMAPLMPPQGEAGAGQPPPPSQPFDVQAHVFEVDRRHGILAATSHFLTVPSPSSLSSSSASAAAALASADAASGGALVPVSTARDPFVCVSEEFDLVLSVAVALPTQVDLGRLDVYFYTPPPPPPLHAHGGAAGGMAQPQPPAASATPYHLVLLPGGAPSPVHDPRGSGVPSDRDLPVLRPDAQGQVRADLTFPAVQIHGLSAGAAGLLVGAGAAGAGALIKAGAGGPHGGSTVFTFGAPNGGPRSNSNSVTGADGSATSGLRSTAATRTFRIRMRATQATTTSSATLNLPLASSAAAVAGAPSGAVSGGNGAAPSSVSGTALHIPGANQALFVTTVVASLAVPPLSSGPAPGAPSAAFDSVSSPAIRNHSTGGSRVGGSTGALQLKVDVLPSKPDDSFVPSVILEQRALERREQEKRAKRKGLPPPPALVDVPLDGPARTPTLRILPQHARAHLRLLHPSPALLGEYYPLQICVQSDGDAIRQGELVLTAAGSGGAGAAGATGAASAAAAGASPSPSGSPSPRAALTSSSSADSLAGMKSGGEDSSLSVGGAGAGAEAAPSAAADEPPVKFFRLTAAGEKLVGRPAASIGAAAVTGEELFEELPSSSSSSSTPGAATLSLPDVAPHGQHTLVVFLRCTGSAAAASSPAVTLSLSYTSAAGVVLGVVASLPSSLLAFRAPFKVKTKIFSDALSGLAPPPPSGAPAVGTGAAGAGTAVVPSQAQRLILQQPVLLHVELENVSGAVLRIDELGLDLSTKFFRNTSRLLPPAASAAAAAGASNGLVQLRPCVSPAAKAALVEASRHASSPDSDDRSSQAAAPAVALAPGEKYTHLFSFVPQLPGKTRFAPLHIRWNRVGNCMHQPPPPQLPVLATVALNDDDEGDDKDSASASAASAAAAPSFSSPSAPVLPPLLYPTCSVSYRKDVAYFHILRAPLGVTLEYPPSVQLGEAFQYTLAIRNATEQMHDVQLALLEGAGAAGAGGDAAAGGAAGRAAGASTAGATASSALVKCVLSGRTRGLLRVRPQSTYRVSYRVCPLECGALSLPRIQLTAAGLTTLAHVSGGAGGAAPAVPAAANVLLMDPNDVGVVFVHPREKTAPAPQMQHTEPSTEATPQTAQPPPPLPPRLR